MKLEELSLAGIELSLASIELSPDSISLFLKLSAF